MRSFTVNTFFYSSEQSTCTCTCVYTLYMYIQTVKQAVHVTEHSQTGYIAIHVGT